MTADLFIVKYPEFRTATAGQIQKALDEAALYVSEAVLFDAYEAAHALKAADILARSPSGIMARMVAKDGSTTYSVQFQQLIQTRVCGISHV